MSDPVVITCAVAGGIDTGNPHQPHTRDQVVDEILGAASAGAAIVHVHARTATGGISQEPADFVAIARMARARVEAGQASGIMHLVLGEDVVHSAPGRYAGSNAELVARSVALCTAIGRPAATADQARETFGVPRVSG
jgi:uncharacterized protein (DUF849 family)